MTQPTLHERLRGLRRRLLLVSGTAGMLWAIVAAALLLLAGMWLDLLWELSPAARIAALAAATLGGVMLWAALGTLGLRAARTALVARRLDKAANSGGMIVSGWELSGGASKGAASNSVGATGTLTAGLATLAVEHATSLAAKAPSSAAVSARPLRHPAISLAVLAAVLALVVVALPALAYTEWRRFSDPFADVPPYSLLTFHVEPGNTKVVYGAGLDVHVEVSGAPVERVELVYREGDGDEESLPMFPESSGKWRAALAKITGEAHYFVRADRARSPAYRIAVVTVPQIRAARWRITPPSYTRDAAYEGPLPKGGVAGLAGTRVQVWASSNRPLSGGTLAVTVDGKSAEVALRPIASQSDEVTGEFMIEASGKFRLHIVDVAGQASQDSLNGTITLLADERPFIRILEPKPVSLATPLATVPVTLAAEDDYGVSKLELYRSLNDSRPLAMELPTGTPPLRRVEERIYLPLADYRVEPGDTIKLFGRVEDNDPAGAKGSESPVVVLRIISQEDFESMLRKEQGLQVLLSKYQQAERRMEGLKKKLEELQQEIKELEQQAEASPAAREKLKRLTRQLREEADAIREAAEQALPYDADGNLTKHLKRLASNLEAMAGAAGDLDQESTLTNEQVQKLLKQLAKKMDLDREQFGREALAPLEHLARVFPLMEDQSRFVILVQQQRDLAERMAALKGHDGEDNPALKARMRDLEQEQRTLRDELQNLLDDIDKHVAELPDDEMFEKLRETATEFVVAVRASGAAEAMSDSAGALSEFAGTRAHAKATEAAEILEKFLSQCQGMGGAAGQCLVFQPGFSNALGDTAAQLLAEMGMNPGMGMGGGPGYSARRNSLNNMGLYGGLPTKGESAGGGSSQDRPGVEGASVSSGRVDADEPTLVESAAATAAGGAGQGVVPLRYRQRVGQYLQRVAEKTGGE